MVPFSFSLTLGQGAKIWMLRLPKNERNERSVNKMAKIAVMMATEVRSSAEEALSTNARYLIMEILKSHDERAQANLDLKLFKFDAKAMSRLHVG